MGATSPGNDRNFPIRGIHSVRLVGLSQFYMESLSVRPSDVNKDGRNTSSTSYHFAKVKPKKISWISAPWSSRGATVCAVEPQSRCFGSTLMSFHLYLQSMVWTSWVKGNFQDPEWTIEQVQAIKYLTASEKILFIYICWCWTTACSKAVRDLNLWPLCQSKALCPLVGIMQVPSPSLQVALFFVVKVLKWEKWIWRDTPGWSRVVGAHIEGAVNRSGPAETLRCNHRAERAWRRRIGVVKVLVHVLDRNFHWLN